jgi:LacI family transcriptional regulator
MQMLAERRVDGIILTSMLRGSSRALVPTLEWLGEVFPVVAVRPGRLHLADTVAVDYQSGTRAAVEHLIQHDARRIAFLGGRSDSASAGAMRSAYEATLRSAGIQIDPDLLTTGEFTYQSAYDRVAALIRNERFDGIFTAADTMALGCLDALADAGLSVPTDARVIGFDDIPAASLRAVQLTTVRGGAAPVGRAAVDLLLDRTENRYQGPPRHIRVPTELVVRKSCGCVGPIGSGYYPAVGVCTPEHDSWLHNDRRETEA